MKKRVVSLLFVCITLLSLLSANVSAAAPNPNSPMWDNTNIFMSDLIFTGTTGNVSVLIVGMHGVDYIAAEVSLFYKNEKGVWAWIQTDWSYGVDGDSLSIEESFTGTPGVEYKIIIEGSVVKDHEPEDLFDYKTAICPTT